jgi:hypothetical protein
MKALRVVESEVSRDTVHKLSNRLMLHDIHVFVIL